MTDQTSVGAYGSLPSQIVLVGAGVVGRAIADAFLQKDISIFLVDSSLEQLKAAREWLSDRRKIFSDIARDFPAGGHYVYVSNKEFTSHTDIQFDGASTGLLIESIVEQLDAKRNFFQSVSQLLGPQFVLTSNTSSLRLQDIATACENPARFGGMHFFMPIKGRDMVEIVRTTETSDQTLETIKQVAARIGKQGLVVADSPALVVNRMLTPYINQGLSLLGMGASDQMIREVSRRFGMPRSPLEMVDMIGARTAFNAGRVAWQAFPQRVEPSPIIPGLVKKGLAGWATGQGFYDYDLTSDPPKPSVQMNKTATEIVAKYQRDVRDWDWREVSKCIAIPMWIEASCILRERVTGDTQSIELAMREGLGFESESGFFGFFDGLGNKEIAESIAKFGSHMKAMFASSDLLDCLSETADATEATVRYAKL